MRAVAMVCLGFVLGGCFGATYQRTPTVAERSMAGLVVAPASTAATPKMSKTRKAHVGNRCAANLKTEDCRLQRELQMARAAELKVEGNTPREIAAIMGVTQETVLDLLMPTGAVVNEQ